MNPTKIVAGGSAGSGLALGLVYLAQRVGWNLTAEDGSAIAVAATAASAFVAHNGIVGIARMIWRGEKKPDPAVVERVARMQIAAEGLNAYKAAITEPPAPPAA